MARRIRVHSHRTEWDGTGEPSTLIQGARRTCGWPALFSAAVLMAGAVAARVEAHELPTDSRPAALREVAFDQRVNEPVPLDVAFRDETGKSVRLGDYLGARPVILVLVYYRCHDLCPLLLEGAAQSLRGIAFNPGEQYSLVVLSFDPRDTPGVAAAKKAALVRRYGKTGAAEGWHFLTGDEAAIRLVTDAVGFHYTYDAKLDEYAHAAGLVILTPQGKIFRYMYGIEFSPQLLRLGLVEASGNRLGSPIDQVLLFCYHYDPSTGKYTVMVMNIIRLAGLLTVGAVATFIVVMRRRERPSAAPIRRG